MSSPAEHADLVHHLVRTTGLPEGTAARVVADIVAYFGETTEQYVRRRHTELRRRGLRNARIWELLAGELTARPVSAGELTERQLRRIVYG